MPDQETFYGQIVGQVIRGRREMQGINLLAMAESMALATPSGWSRVETGDTAMTLAQLRKAAKKLGMEPADIVQQADALASQLEASGVVVNDEKPKNVGKWLLGGAGILALVAAGAAGASAVSKAKTPKATNNNNKRDDGEEEEPQ
jgi:transcriptional regulator with XRE-family HTH domain